MILALVMQKGGVGKSMIAINLSLEALRRGRPVLVVDADPQATACDFALDAQKNFWEVPPLQEGSEDMHESPEIKEASREGLVILDTPGRMDAVQRSALMTADIALMPCGPAKPDLHALRETVALVKEAQAVRRQQGSVLKAAIVLSRVRLSTALHRGARGSIEKEKYGIPLFNTELGERIVFQEAWAEGRGVVDYAPDSRAACEVAKLYDELLALGAQDGEATTQS